MNRVVRGIAVSLGALLFVAGCVRSAPEPLPGYWVSSDSSGYSPVARFRVFATRSNRGLDVVLDSGRVAIPGNPGMPGPPLMNHLYLTAILAERDTGTMAVVREGGTRGMAERRGWRVLATSDSTPLVGELRYGEVVSIPTLRLTVPVGFRLVSDSSWLVFRISGNGVAVRAPLAPGGALRVREIPGGVDVYVCGNRDVFGRYDAGRAAALKQAYRIAC